MSDTRRYCHHRGWRWWCSSWEHGPLCSDGWGWGVCQKPSGTTRFPGPYQETIMWLTLLFWCMQEQFDMEERMEQQRQQSSRNHHNHMVSWVFYFIHIANFFICALWTMVLWSYANKKWCRFHAGWSLCWLGLDLSLGLINELGIILTRTLRAFRATAGHLWRATP